MFECRGAALLGILHEPLARRSRTGILIIVGGPQYRVGSHRQFVLMARSLADAGFAVMRFDYRGMGDSDGEMRGFEFVDGDIAAAIEAFAKAVPQLDGVVLWGLCDAGSAALMYCSGDARVRAVIIANPWVHTQAAEAKSYLRHYYGRRLLQLSFWRKLLSLRVAIGVSMRDFLRKIINSRKSEAPGLNAVAGSYISRMLKGLRSFREPVLILLSERDLTARQFADLTATNREWTKTIGRANVSIKPLAGTDHTFSNREGLVAATDYCISWLERVIVGPGAPTHYP